MVTSFKMYYANTYYANTYYANTSLNTSLNGRERETDPLVI